ncbi:hypothetical protein LCGC14_0225580 [marine sediment metagenome]|uniref:Histidine kinase N-terminal 7TM region domain-containing protein n=1 Tax=marine sediment metagenome TaxID=412755 RepID=A0A0F9UBR0_9ZZZZ|nr:hypothetical protein [Phycisphaerae bacterium]HDZ42988.1 hypothetical protein [Phycisphaerae bacterium]
MVIGPENIRSVIKPLRLIFWGGLLWILDFKVSQTVNGTGFQFDILNDTLAAVLVAWGVLSLARFSVSDRYTWWMKAVWVVSVIAIVNTIHDHFIYDVPEGIAFLQLVLELASLIAIVVFCTAMGWFCAWAGLERSGQSWAVTRILFIVIYLVPLGLFYLIAAGAILTGKFFNINLGPEWTLLIVVFFIPMIHLFMSTSRMAKEVEK